MAAGGATVAGASLVVSSPALAYDAPTITPSGSLSMAPIGDPDAGRFQVIVNQYPTASCPSSAINTPGLPTAPITERTITATSLSIEAGHVWRATPELLGVNTALTPSGSFTETYPPGALDSGAIGEVRKRTTTTPAEPAPVISGDSFSVDIEVVFTCTYSDGTTSTASNTFSATFTAP